MHALHARTMSAQPRSTCSTEYRSRLETAGHPPLLNKDKTGFASTGSGTTVCTNISENWIVLGGWVNFKAGAFSNKQLSIYRTLVDIHSLILLKDKQRVELLRGLLPGVFPLGDGGER